jgi:hypothetical protein
MHHLDNNDLICDLDSHDAIHPSIYLSMALQPFVGPWPLFQFLDILHGQ